MFDFPARFGNKLLDDIRHYGQSLLNDTKEKISIFFPDMQPLPMEEQNNLEHEIISCGDVFEEFNLEYIADYLYCR